MFRGILVLLTLIFSTLNISAQTPSQTAPTNWERYKFGEKEVSVLLPKMPVRDWDGDSCKGEQTSLFGAYSDQVVYVFGITNKIKVNDYCKTKKEFGKQNFAQRVAALKYELASFGDIEELNKKSENGNEEVWLVGKTRIYTLINDFKNNRWFELRAIGAIESKIEVKNFLASLKTGKDATGKEIGDGSPFTIGDEKKTTDSVADKPVENNSSANPIQTNTPVNAVLKPRPDYTEIARQANIQGTVRLRVLFNANGSIGSVTPISGLGYGLTEKAIQTARKIVFVPAVRNGVTYTVIKEVVYTFNLF